MYILGEYKARNEQMITYQKITKNLMEEFKQVFINQIPRKEKTQADTLAQLAKRIC